MHIFSGIKFNYDLNGIPKQIAIQFYMFSTNRSIFTRISLCDANNHITCKDLAYWVIRFTSISHCPSITGCILKETHFKQWQLLIHHKLQSPLTWSTKAKSLPSTFSLRLGFNNNIQKIIAPFNLKWATNLNHFLLICLILIYTLSPKKEVSLTKFKFLQVIQQKEILIAFNKSKIQHLPELFCLVIGFTSSTCFTTLKFLFISQLLNCMPTLNENTCWLPNVF